MMIYCIANSVQLLILIVIAADIYSHKYVLISKLHYIAEKYSKLYFAVILDI